jgi:hypothetical protein
MDTPRMQVATLGFVVAVLSLVWTIGRDVYQEWRRRSG